MTTNSGLHRDVDYLVRDGGIELIDEFTGRVAENRRWPFGLQAAIEAKEGVAIQADGAILGSITLQHFLQQYERLAGMTGTAVEAADEIYEFYDLKVVVIPTHRPCIRRDEPDVVFDSEESRISLWSGRFVKFTLSDVRCLLVRQVSGNPTIWRCV